MPRDREEDVCEQQTWEHSCVLRLVDSWVRKTSVNSNKVLGGSQAYHGTLGSSAVAGKRHPALGLFSLALHTCTICSYIWS